MIEMSNYKSSREYTSKEDWLKLLLIKIIENGDKLYLVDLNETFNQRIYSKSHTDIKRGLDKLKKIIKFVLIQMNQKISMIKLSIIYSIKNVLGAVKVLNLIVMLTNTVLKIAESLENRKKIEIINGNKEEILIIMKKDWVVLE